MSPKTAAMIGRGLLTLSVLSLIGAWITQWTSSNLFGMSQVHLFSDAIATGLLAVGFLLDAKLHSQKI